MFQIEYTKKPSVTTINAAIKNAINNGQNWIQLIWGENQILIEKDKYGWTGYGWIGKNSGQDIAHTLNTESNKKFIRDHFQIIHIG